MMGPMASDETPDDGDTPDTARAGHAARPPARSAWTPRLVVAALVLAALNLRPAITSLGALLEEVRDGLGMSGSVAGLLTSVPPLCFAVFGVTAPRLARRFGPAAVVCAGMAAITAGLALRPFAGGTAGFLAASALALVGIAVSNVLMPVIVKRWFPDRVGSMTGLYSMALALGTSSAAAVTVPLTTRWAALAVRTGGLGRLPRPPCCPGCRSSAAGSPRPRPPAPAPAAARPAPRRRAGSPAAAPPGRSPASSASRPPPRTSPWAGCRRSSATPGSPPAPRACCSPSPWPWAYRCPSSSRAGRPDAAPGPARRRPRPLRPRGLRRAVARPGRRAAWAVLLGVANCAFPLALTMIGMRSRTAAGVVRLSAFAQCTGYLISIPGPLLVGALYQHSGGWGLPIALMAA